MSVFIGNVNGPDHNSPTLAGDVWASRGGVELRVFEGIVRTKEGIEGIARSFDPIAARNLAALLVRASEEVERMRARKVGEE
jgi:hypothetical protein